MDAIRDIKIIWFAFPCFMFNEVQAITEGC